MTFALTNFLRPRPVYVILTSKVPEEPFNAYIDVSLCSPCQQHRKHVENSMENMHTDVKVLRV